MVNIYAACTINDKKILWEELSTVKSASQEKVWCLCGDFNAVRSRSERKGIREGSDYSSEIIGFNNFIDANLLLDLPIVGKNYMWFKSNGSAKSRIDRVLVSEEWFVRWPMSKQYVQRREVSDHCAIVVKSVEKDWEPKSFRTIDAWFLERSFNEMVKEKWLSYPIKGNALVNVKEKLKSLKGDLKIWNKEVFGNVYTRKKEILQENEEFDCMDCLNDLNEGDRLKKAALGDSCTRFYHSSLRWRRLRNEVKGVEVGGQWCEEPCTVRSKAKKLFDIRFKATKDFGVRLDEVEFKFLSQEDNVSLTMAFSEEEIRDTV
ncbi:uncharacterized protein [Phaseolus vulgaris]|uniref:uncharacterized protein n=1 Tax=Phaseolus vulgaris TaxID=3885 RepID=UPI0035CAB9C0